MAYELEPLRSYVRFYLAIVKQLEQAQETLVRTHEMSRKALEPFAPVREHVQNSALTEALAERSAQGPGLSVLWRPEDERDLTGLTDVYEVVGRFSFEGEERENLDHVQRIVSQIRTDVLDQRQRLQDLQQLADDVEKTAARERAERSHRAAENRNDQLKRFSTFVTGLHQRAKQTTEAVHGVPVPPLTDVSTAPDEYRGYVTKLDQVYQTCLPFLRTALDDLYGFSGLEAPASWPDTLPVEPELPEELLTVPPSDSPELRRAKQQLDTLSQEETALQQTHDDLVATLRRLQAEVANEQEKRTASEQAVNSAKWGLLYAKKLMEVENARQESIDLEQQRANRSYKSGDLLSKSKQTEASIDAMVKELAKRKFEIGEVGKQLAHERDNEPAIFGKDDWRNRVATLEAQIEQLRQAYAQREAVLNQMKIDMSSLGVEVQNEQAQLATLERWMQDTKARAQAAMAEVKQLEERMGEARPVVAPTVAEAEQHLADAQNALSDVLERIERLKAELRRNHEEGTRVLARQNQIKLEKDKMMSYMQSAKVAATQGFQEAMRQLAERRRRGVEQHVGEIIGQLDKSLQAVDEVFVEPAKEALLAKLEPDMAPVEKLREQIPLLREITQRLKEEIEPDLMAQEASMSRVQREFCDAAEQACRSAWS